jgi:hypothetical protein
MAGIAEREQILGFSASSANDVGLEFPLVSSLLQMFAVFQPPIFRSAYSFCPFAGMELENRWTNFQGDLASNRNEYHESLL